MACGNMQTDVKKAERMRVMALYKLGELSPKLDATAWVAEGAHVMGDVVMGPHASVWYNAVLRGDTSTITVGENSNVQDGSVLHADEGKPLTIGANVTIGHMVMLHGCTIGDGSLIGIGAVVLNDAVIGRNCIVGAGSLVTEGKTFPDNSMIMGTPAKVVRELSPEQRAGLARSAASYVANAQHHAENLTRIDAPRPDVRK